MWFAYSVGPDELHIIPENDLVEHTYEDDCVCGPKITYVFADAKMVMHFSLDGRELDSHNRMG